jgi:hypothetical protein
MDLVKVHRAAMNLIAESLDCCGLTPFLEINYIVIKIKKITLRK